MRMLYHYYGSKEQLYLAVLESIYEDIREQERKLELEHLAPIEGIAALVDFTFAHFADNPTFVLITRNRTWNVVPTSPALSAFRRCRRR